MDALRTATESTDSALPVSNPLEHGLGPLLPNPKSALESFVPRLVFPSDCRRRASLDVFDDQPELVLSVADGLGELALAFWFVDPRRGRQLGLSDGTEVRRKAVASVAGRIPGDIVRFLRSVRYVKMNS